MNFPRQDDGKGWAWGLRSDAPQELWERFSPAYEAQAQEVLTEIEHLGLKATLDFAGSEDGECALGRTPENEIALYIPLEDPVEAKLISAARARGTLAKHLSRLMA